MTHRTSELGGSWPSVRWEGCSPKRCDIIFEHSLTDLGYMYVQTIYTMKNITIYILNKKVKIQSVFCVYFNEKEHLRCAI